MRTHLFFLWALFLSQITLPHTTWAGPIEAIVQAIIQDFLADLPQHELEQKNLFKESFEKIQDDLQESKVLGFGASGRVIQLESSDQTKAFAYKEFKVPRTSDLWSNEYDAAAMRFLRELNVLLQCSGQPHLMSVIAWKPPDGQVSPGVFMPLMQANLSQFLRQKNKPLEKDTVQSILSQITNGLVALHGMKIVHSDLKPANILLDAHLQIKIADFERSHYFAECNHIHSDEEICTQWYRAPELILRGAFGSKVDIFSLGCITYECLTGTVLFYSGIKETEIDHLLKIFQICGSPSESNWPEGRGRQNYKKYSKQYEDQRKTVFSQKLNHAPEFILSRSS